MAVNGMKETWYKILKDEKYCSEVLDIFCALHDYMITDINYEYQNKTLKIYFRYDSDDEGAVLKFLGVKRLNIFAADESQWVMGTKVRPTTDNTLLWCDIEDDLSAEELVKGTDYNWVEADEIHFAWLDKNNEIIPLTEGRLNPVWRILNYETGKYEDVRRHFEVYEVGE